MRNLISNNFYLNIIFVQVIHDGACSRTRGRVVDVRLMRGKLGDFLMVRLNAVTI